jgi:hypothetical protein
MSTFVDLLPRTLDDVCEPGIIEVEREELQQRGLASWDPDAFAEEQIRGLVRQVFLPGWPKPGRQVVFSAVDPEVDISSICMQVGLALSAQVPGTSCLVEANLSGPGLELLHTEGVMGLISFRGVATPIPVKQIDDLQRLLSQKVPCALHAFLKVGQRVRIRGGCLDGLEGILEQRGEKNLVVSIESIQRAVVITIEGYELELI